MTNKNPSRASMALAKVCCVIWAGDDLYSLEEITSNVAQDPQATYQEISRRLLSKVTQDFGTGAELMQGDKPLHYRINVDHVSL